LKLFAARLARRDLSVSLTEKAADYLAEVGWDPQYGARPLKRAIRKQLEDPLAKRVLAGTFPPGTAIVVDRGPSGELTFTAKTLN
jgi:ATP-dependent Clp protease ATP-binding subunit ClpB